MKTARYKVIADFPCSMHKVGDIIIVYETGGMAYVCEINGESEKVDITEYPHLYELILTPKTKAL